MANFYYQVAHSTTLRDIRSPGDFRRMATFRLARQRLGLRRPSAAFSRRHNPRGNVQRGNVQLKLRGSSAMMFRL